MIRAREPYFKIDMLRSNTGQLSNTGQRAEPTAWVQRLIDRWVCVKVSGPFRQKAAPRVQGPF